MLATIGGRFGGWGLWLDESKPKFTYAAVQSAASTSSAWLPRRRSCLAITSCEWLQVRRRRHR